jgi:hypothetical protein
MGAAGARAVPAGWLDETGLELGAVGSQSLLRFRVEPLWHSWLTGLWRAKRTSLRIWYPGGAPLEAAERLELRDA